MTSALFIDTSAWIALLDVSDGEHCRAERCWQEALAEGRRFLTCDYVLDEAYTLLRRRRNGLRMAEVLHELVTTSEVVETAEVDVAIRGLGWDLFVAYQDKVLSYTDCTSFALMRSRMLLESFTFDSDFERVGFVTLPGRGLG